MTEPRRITSLQNPTIKRVRSLTTRKGRRETGLFLAEGLKVVATARDRGWVPRVLLMPCDADLPATAGDLIAWAGGHGADVLAVPMRILATLSGRDNPQTVLAAFDQTWADPPPAPAAGDVWIALEEVRDPGNLGTIIRTADGVGARGVILVGTCCDAFAIEVVRATMGSIFAVPLVRQTPEAFSAGLDHWPGDIVGTHLAATEDYRTAYRGPVLLVMGSEGPGLSEDLAGRCRRLVRIPMAGQADSLNLAVATAVMLYEIRRPVLGVTVP